MKRLVSTMLVCLMAIISLQAQAPEGISYQAVARDGNGATLAKQSIDVRFTVRTGSPTGAAVYAEEHSSTTNDYGLFSLSIGMGAATTGTFDAINWGTGNHYLQVEVDAGAGFVNLGTTQMMSVPYALYAKEAGNSSSYNAGAGIDITGNTITNTGDTDGSDDITNGSAAGGDLSGSYPNPTVSAIQGRNVSSNAPAAGEVLKWNGSAWAPGNDNSGGGSYNAGTGIDITGNTISADNIQAIWNANELQGREVSSNAPVAGEVLKWNGSAWAPAADATGGGGSSVWSTSGNEAYYTAGNVGIGTSNPSEALDVNGVFQLAAGNEQFNFAVNNGDLEIRPNGGILSAMTIQDTREYIGLFGNSPITPSSYLDLNTDPGVGAFGGMYVNTASATGKPFYGYATNGNEGAWTYLNGGDNSWRVNIGNNDRLTVTSAGRVGIGTTNPSNELEVVGEVSVTGTNSWVNIDAGGNTGYRIYDNTSFKGGLFYDDAEDNIKLTRSFLDPAIIIDANNNVGINITTPATDLAVGGEFLVENGLASVRTNADNSTQFLEITNDNLTNASDVIAIQVQNTAPDNAQFIEFQRGFTVEARINTDGTAEFENVEVEETTETPRPNTLYGNALPLAYGYISNASILEDYGLTSITSPSTGRYVITLDHAWAGIPVVMVTSYDLSGRVEVASYNYIGNNQIEVNIVNSAGTPISSNFSIVVFGTAQ